MIDRKNEFLDQKYRETESETIIGLVNKFLLSPPEF